MTDAEVMLWSRLRRQGQGNHRFRKQHPIGPYIADFACVAAKLVVEVDGYTHGSDAEVAYDRRRDAYMTSLGWRVFRVTNEDVYKRLGNVLEGIALALQDASEPLRRTANAMRHFPHGLRTGDESFAPVGAETRRPFLHSSWCYPANSAKRAA